MEITTGTPTASARRKRRLTVLLTTGTLAALAVGGGSAWALDRFVVDHVEISDVSSYEAQHKTTQTSSTTGAAQSANSAQSATPTSSPEEVAASATTTDTTYTSDNTSITVKTVTMGSGSDTVTYHVADVRLTNGTDLKSAFANNAFGQNITALVSETATANGAVLAINGDYYGFRDTGIVIRNGVVYRDKGTRQGLAIHEDGTMRVYDETSTDAQTLVDQGVWQTLSFGPALVEGGAMVEGIDSVEIDTNFGNHSIQGNQPRTAIGIVDANHFVFVVVDGRAKGHSRGVTMTELAKIMVDLGATTAYNLDGGGSSELWFNGQVVNRPSNGGERETSDILYVAAGA
ncbi:phosphodiester glycosidase family protein [Schaalia sp. 19OD2882]|uniref:phosphodiester glycosidase family protein n=1 Tax=Schaalia sp. 19OD2882 TaxID=2794089 RepID=UPI001C1F1D3C|nr:phosphodiester glycosidase family protein [Schaalia sp. 19OD2882]QWW19344.1 phosphodiester glycosidase family protein [Schaalia sp. 19OD2882]